MQRDVFHVSFGECNDFNSYSHVLAIAVVCVCVCVCVCVGGMGLGGGVIEFNQ